MFHVTFMPLTYLLDALDFLQMEVISSINAGYSRSHVRLRRLVSMSRTLEAEVMRRVRENVVRLPNPVPLLRDREPPVPIARSKRDDALFDWLAIDKFTVSGSGLALPGRRGD